MTPKEKAEELIKKMLSKNPNIQDGISIIDSMQAKLCALVAVDEIINTVECVSYNEIELDVKYWQEVKQEIDNLWL